MKKKNTLKLLGIASIFLLQSCGESGPTLCDCYEMGSDFGEHKEACKELVDAYKGDEAALHEAIEKCEENE